MRIGSYNYSTGEAFDTHGVALGRFDTQSAAQKAMWAAAVPNDFWDRTAITPVPLLKELNDWVIAHNERRLPKWKFKFASDLAVQIQPRITRAHPNLFEGIGLRTEDVTVKLFTEATALRNHPHPYYGISFHLFGDDNGPGWWLKPTGARRSKRAPVAGLVELRQRLRDEIRPERFKLTPTLMLSPSCLCCGKALTDPASQARWVGPECAGSASTNLPRIFKATEPDQEVAGGAP